MRYTGRLTPVSSFVTVEPTHLQAPFPHSYAAPKRARTVLAVDGDDDAALMRAYAAGDMRAFETLYQRHKGPLYRYLVRQSRDRELANDLFQETWSRVVTSRDRYEARAKFQTFLYTIAHNCFIDHCRRSAVRPSANEDVDAEQLVPAPMSERPEIQAEHSELRQRYQQALESLPGEQRDAFLLYEESGLSLDAIGSITGVTMETAKSRLRYALAKLRQALEPEVDVS